MNAAPLYIAHAREAARYAASRQCAPRRERRHVARVARSWLQVRAAQLTWSSQVGLPRSERPTVSQYWLAFSHALALQPAASRP